MDEQKRRENKIDLIADALEIRLGCERRDAVTYAKDFLVCLEAAEQFERDNPKESKDGDS